MLKGAFEKSGTYEQNVSYEWPIDESQVLVEKHTNE